MSLSKSLGIVASAAAFASCALAAEPDGDKLARELLLKSMRRTLSMNVIAIVERRGEADGMMRRVKLEQSGGRQALTVLAPLSVSGVTFVDDGHKRFTYIPDEKTLFEERSIRPLQHEFEKRLQLTDRNYTLSLERSEPVAGRQTLLIVAVPKSSSLPQRMFVVDEETAFLLRMATVCPDGEREVYVNTKVVSYPKSLPSNRFEKDPLGAARRILRDSPDGSCERSELAETLGFLPRKPAKLPFGFAIQTSEVRKSSEGRSFAMRLTDGLASAVVYQFLCDGPLEDGIRHSGNRSMLREGDMAVALVSDLPLKVRTTLLESFIRNKAKIASAIATATRAATAAPKSIPGPPLELFKPKPLFSFEEKHEAVAEPGKLAELDPDPVPVLGPKLGPL